MHGVVNKLTRICELRNEVAAVSLSIHGPVISNAVVSGGWGPRSVITIGAYPGRENGTVACFGAVFWGGKFSGRNSDSFDLWSVWNCHAICFGCPVSLRTVQCTKLAADI